MVRGCVRKSPLMLCNLGLGCRKRGCVKGGVILRFFRLSTFVCVCSCLHAFICVWGPFSESLKPAFVCVRMRLQTPPPFITPPFAAPWLVGRFWMLQRCEGKSSQVFFILEGTQHRGRKRYLWFLSKANVVGDGPFLKAFKTGTSLEPYSISIYLSVDFSDVSIYLLIYLLPRLAPSQALSAIAEVVLQESSVLLIGCLLGSLFSRFGCVFFIAISSTRISGLLLVVARALYMDLVCWALRRRGSTPTTASTPPSWFGIFLPTTPKMNWCKRCRACTMLASTGCQIINWPRKGSIVNSWLNCLGPFRDSDGWCIGI